MQQLKASVNQAYDGFCGYIEKNNRMTEFGLYGLSTGILAYAYFRRRPITKFTRASDIPKHFVEEKVLQTGVVKKIEPTEFGPLLHINHKPPVNVSFGSQALPTRVAGVNIDGNGFSWLQILATSQEVKFVPLGNKGKECMARVYLIEKSKEPLDIGRALVGLGFARAAPRNDALNIELDENFIKYHKMLQRSESKAKRLRKGQWSSLPENWLRWKVRTELDKLFFRLKPEHMKIPKLVR